MKQPGAKSIWLLTVGMSLVLSTAVCAAAGPALAPAYANPPMAASSATPPTGNEIRISGLGNGSAPWTIVVLLTLLTLIPSILLCMTPFARLLVVFHFLRQALGLQTTPSNQTLIGLALILTFFLMQPVGAISHLSDFCAASARRGIFPPCRRWSAEPRGRCGSSCCTMSAKKTLRCLSNYRKSRDPEIPNDLSLRDMVAPAYILSELRMGFQIGTVLFLPFLVIDMVVASISTSVGMLQLPPVVISTPLKLLLFVMVDGGELFDRIADEEL